MQIGLNSKKTENRWHSLDYGNSYSLSQQIIWPRGIILSYFFQKEKVYKNMLLKIWQNLLLNCIMTHIVFTYLRQKYMLMVS